MSRATFGGTAGDFLAAVGSDGLVRAVPGTLTMWSAETGGVQYTDLLLDGAPVTEIPVGNNGQVPVFQGPDAIVSMWADAGFGRVRLLSDQTTASLDSDSFVAGRVADDASETAAAIDARIAAAVDVSFAPIPYLEGVPVYIYGDSYTQIAPPEATPGPQVARKNRMLAPVNRGVSGSRFSQIYDRIAATWTPNTRGMVVIGDGTINNIQAYPANATGYATAREAFRACLAFLSARAVTTVTDGGVTRFGPGWTSGAEGFTGGAGSYVDIAWDSGPCDVLLRFRAGAGGTIEFRNTAGNVVATAVTGGFSEDITGAVAIPTQGVGVHTIRATVTAGTVTLQRIAARAATPPLIVWDKAGPIPFGGTAVGTTELRASQAQEILAAQDYGVLVADNDVAGWNPATMISNDTAHRNDRGNQFATETMDAALRSEVTSYVQGLNALTYYDADAPYVAPTASYSGPGATAPNAPVLTASPGFQVSLSWTRPTDGGSTLTGYRIESSPAGAGTWSLVATIASPTTSTHKIISGLTPGTDYDFRIRAVNAIGNGTWSTTDSAVAGALPTIYSLDDFERPADPLSMGTAVQGGAWGYGNSVFGLSGGGRAVDTGSKTTPANFNFATVNDGQKDGFVEVTIAKQDAVLCGLVMNANLALATQSWVLYAYAGQYLLRAQTGANAYAAIAAYAITPQDGDRIGLFHSGLTVTAVINGLVLPTYTGAAEYTGTRHGLFSYGNAEWSDYQHTNIDPR